MKSIDILRNRYVSSPNWMKMAVDPILSILPYRFLYGKTYLKTLKLIEESKKNPDFVLRYQLNSLNKIIETGRNINGHYIETLSRVFKNYESSIENLEELPILDKEEIRNNIDKFLVRPRSELDEVSTSGSFGRPLKFYLDRDRSPKELAFIHQIWSRIGFRPGRHRRAVMRGVFLPNVDKKPWQYDSALSELKLSPFHMVPETMELYLRLIEKYKINFIHGYPSAITLLFGFAKSINWKIPASLIGILPISESIFDYQRSIILGVFPGLKILSFYGQSEKVAIAGEVNDSPNVFEFEPLYGIVELVDDKGNRIQETGRRGRVVATGLLSQGMPFLRYDTGDTAELVELGSRKNCYRMRVREIRSRRGEEYIIGYNGALISFSAINLHSRHFSNIQQFQLYQEKKGEVTVKVVPYSGQNSEKILSFVAEMQAKVGSNVKFSLQIVDFLSPNPRGKRHFIDQKLSLKKNFSPKTYEEIV